MDSTVGQGKIVAIGAVRWDALCANGRQLLLDHGFELIENHTGLPYDKADMLRVMPGADAAVCGVEVWDEEVLTAAPRVKAIARLGVGLDNIDLSAARARGIDVTNVPGGNAIAVGELALGLIISLSRQFDRMGVELRAGRWDRYVGRELTGKKVGLIGFGSTAQALTRLLRGFACEVVAYDPYADPSSADELSVRLVPLAEAFDADVVSVHAPHVPATHHIVNSRTLAGMRTGSILINVARGPLVDEAALLDALQSGQLAGAGLDVFEVEPLDPSSPLLRLPNVAVTTHAGADTAEAYDRIGLATARAIIDVFSGRAPLNLAN